MNKRIGIMVFPMAKANIKPSCDFVRIIKDISQEATVIVVHNTGTDVNELSEMFLEYTSIFRINHKSGKNIISRILRYVILQLKESYLLAKLSRDIHIWFLFIGDAELMPVVTSKLLKKSVVLVMGGYLEREMMLKDDLAGKILILFKKINLRLSDKIILYSANLVNEWGLEKYQEKIYIAHRHFLDFNKFRSTKNLNERENLVGYIGRFSEEKGIMDFIRAIPEVIRINNEVRFIIGGDGPLFVKLERYLNANELNDHVKLVGWIPHDRLPYYLNELKLLVIPSISEGLPNIVLESLACGTPVLATSVGAIPDIIKDKETGFILKNGDCLAKEIVDILNYPDLGRIIENGKNQIHLEFTYEKALEGYQRMLMDIDQTYDSY